MKQQFKISVIQFAVCFSVLFLCIFNWYVTASAVKKVLPKPNIPAVFAFGDSIIDPGNNNNLPLTLVKANFPPYGMNFRNKKATGRFSNGRLSTDFLVEALGIKKLLPAYFNATLKDKEFMSGVSFASASAGYDPFTSKSYLVIPLKQQLQMYKDYIGKLKNKVGAEKAQDIINRSAHVVVCGTDDITQTYFSNPFLKAIYNADKFTDLVKNGASSFIKKLYKQGARKIYVTNLPPIQCLPSQRTLGGGLARKCAKDREKIAKEYNAKLESELKSLNQTYSDAHLVLWDLYNIVLDLIQNYQKYGYKVPDKGCCGSGLIEVSVLCNRFSPTCKNATEHIFWDSYHPSERTNQLVINKIVDKYKPHFF